MPSVHRAALLLAALGAVMHVGCSGCSRDRSQGTGGATGAAERTERKVEIVGKTEKALDTSVIDFVGDFDDCTLSHRGVLLDLGDPTMRTRMSGGRFSRPDVEMHEHAGATWASLHERSLDLSFISLVEPKPDAGVVIEARLRGGAARNVSVFFDGKPVATFAASRKETRGEITVVSARAPNATILRGSNELSLRVPIGARAPRDEQVEIDWIRVGSFDGDAPYAAPTRADALTTVTIGGVARRGLSLRAPGSARCGGFVPSGSILEGHLGVSGGEAEAEVRLYVDRAEPRVVGTFQLGGDDAPAWRAISVPLGDVGTLAAVELVATSSTKGARVVFAEPRVVAPPPQQEPRVAREPGSATAARGVVLVVLGSIAPRGLSAWGGTTPTPALASLVAGGSSFESHRASSGLASAAMASMLTGLSPREHGAAEADLPLSTSGPTIAEAARQGGVVTAMFTANPTTSAPFGFARGFETFGERMPTEEEPATTVFEDAAAWLDAHARDRFLLVVHARGGHPPWDATSEELKEMPPADYAGNLDPRHAGELLARVRRGGAGRIFGDADRQRAIALHERALTTHDAALGELLARLRHLGREADTTVIVTGDIGVDGSSAAPFIDDEGLDEAALAIPLVVREPGKAAARVTAPTSSVDLARTVLDALGLPPPETMRGESVWNAGTLARPRPRLATTATRFSARWGNFVLAGGRDRGGKLCDLSLEPECVYDVRATHPLAAELMHTFVFDRLVAPARPTGPEPHAPPPFDATTSSSAAAGGAVRVVRVVPEPPLAAALRLWHGGK